MDRALQLLRFLTRVLLYIATFVSATFGYMQYRHEHGEPIGDILELLLSYLALPFWCWVGIAIVAAALLFFLGWRSQLNKLGKLLLQTPDDHEIRREMWRQLRFSRFTKRYRELAPLYLCTRWSPACARVHGAAILLTATSSPRTLFRVIVWLRQKLTSNPHGFSYPLEMLKILVEGLQTQINRQRWFWSKDLQKTFRQVAMDTYNSVAYYVVEALKKSLFLLWQQKRSRRYPVKALQNAPLEGDAIIKYQQEWQNEGQDFTNTTWDLFETTADPIYQWLNSLHTPVEVEEATLTQIIPTLFALPVKASLSHDQITKVVPKMQQLAERIMPVIWRSREDYGFEIWLRRLQLVLKTGVLVYLWRWLDTGGRESVLERTWGELERLYEGGREEDIRAVDTAQLFAEFDKHLEKVVGSISELDESMVQNLVDRIESLSKRARSENALPIATTCESVTRKLKMKFEPV